MQVSHIIYKVDKLKEGFEYFKNKGFNVEYGSKKNPHNALIYFTEGPYIEIVAKAPLPFYAKLILKLIGKRSVVERLERWEREKEGFIELCLENYHNDFNEEKRILKKYNQGFFVTKSKRLDPANRLFKWKLLFPDELRIPFLMTYFNIDPKPKNYTHPNGIIRIKHISYGTDAEFFPLLNELCTDASLQLVVGKGVSILEYEQQSNAS